MNNTTNNTNNAITVIITVRKPKYGKPYAEIVRNSFSPNWSEQICPEVFAKMNREALHVKLANPQYFKTHYCEDGDIYFAKVQLFEYTWNVRVIRPATNTEYSRVMAD